MSCIQRVFVFRNLCWDFMCLCVVVLSSDFLFRTLHRCVANCIDTP